MSCRIVWHGSVWYGVVRCGVTWHRLRQRQLLITLPSCNRASVAAAAWGAPAGSAATGGAAASVARVFRFRPVWPDWPAGGRAAPASGREPRKIVIVGRLRHFWIPCHKDQKCLNLPPITIYCPGLAAPDEPEATGGERPKRSARAAAPGARTRSFLDAPASLRRSVKPQLGMWREFGWSSGGFAGCGNRASSAPRGCGRTPATALPRPSLPECACPDASVPVACYAGPLRNPAVQPERPRAAARGPAGPADRRDWGGGLGLRNLRPLEDAVDGVEERLRLLVVLLLLLVVVVVVVVAVVLVLFIIVHC